jgi:hypothetical protein
MPFYCGKRSADICVVLGPKQSRPPHHLGGAHKHGATYSSHRAPSTYSLGKERVLARLGRAGVIGHASGFFAPAASHLPAAPFPRNEGLLGQTPSPRLIRIIWRGPRLILGFPNTSSIPDCSPNRAFIGEANGPLFYSMRVEWRRPMSISLSVGSVVGVQTRPSSVTRPGSEDRAAW